MKTNQHLMKTADPSRSGTFLTDPCVIVNRIKRAGQLALALGATVLLAAGCSSTGGGFTARLISPVPNSRQATNIEDDGWYAPARSVDFDPDLFGS